MNPRVLVMSESTLFGGMEQGSMSLDLRIMQELGWSPVVALKVWPELRTWATQLRQSGIDVVDYAPPPFLVRWDRWRVRRLKKLWGRLGFSRLVSRYEPAGLVCYSSSVTDCLTQLWQASLHPHIPRVLSVHSSYAAEGIVSTTRGIGLEPPPRWDAWQTRHLIQAFAGLGGLRSVSQETGAGFLRAFRDTLPAGLAPTTIYHGVDLQHFRPPTPEERLAARRALGQGDDTVVLGTVCGLTARKGVLQLLETYVRLQRLHPQLRLVFAGEGPQRAELTSAIQAAGLTQQVSVLGHREDVRQVLWGLDVFALFSSVEGLGWATIEAMSVGLPVVATNAAGTREVVRHGETGILFPYGEWDRAEEAISLLITRPDLAKDAAAKGRRRAEDVFGIREREEKVTRFLRTSLRL